MTAPNATVETADEGSTARPAATPPVPGRVGRIAMWAVAAAIVGVLPFVASTGQVEEMAGWICIAIAACGLNLLTGFNGQISVGHGALYGTGSYAAVILMSRSGWSPVPAIVAATVITFFVGVVIGLPALRIKGLYLALVTLAVAVLFPLMIEQFPDLTGGSSGLTLTTRVQNRRGGFSDQTRQFDSPFGFLNSAQWRYFAFLAVAIAVYLFTRNLVHSRAGRAVIAVRDNELSAEVQGIPVARVKIVVFGLSSAMAGLGGALLAINLSGARPTSFTLLASIYFLVAVVVGGAASVIGPAIGVVFYGVATEVLQPELPDVVKPATPVLLGAMLVLLMFFAPGGIVGLYKTTRAKMAVRRLAAGAGSAATTPTAEPAPL